MHKHLNRQYMSTKKQQDNTFTARGPSAASGRGRDKHVQEGNMMALAWP